MSQIANVIEMRREAERDFVRAAACGIVQRVIEADSVLAVCPSGLISHDLQAQAVYSAIAAIAADRKRPDPVSVGEWVIAHGKDYPGVGMADVANFYALSIASAREESILHLAAVVRREGLKQQAESKLLGMVADC